MKKYYSAAICALAGLFLVAGVMGNTKTVYAAQEMQDAASAIIEGEEMTDDAMTPEAESLDVMAEGAGHESVSMSDGRTVSGSIADQEIPLLFHKITVSFKGQTVEAAQFDNGNIILLYVMDSSGEPYFMRYDEATDSLVDFRMIPGPSDKYIMVMEPDETVETPVGYEKAVLDWNGQSLTAFVNTAAVTMSDTFTGSDAQPADYFLIYGLSSTGRLGFYLYDQVEGTYQRYLDLAAVGITGGSSSGKLIDFKAVSEGDSQALIRLIIVGIMALVIVILIVIVIVMSIKLKDYAGYEYIDEEDYNAINGYNGNSAQSNASLQKAKSEYADKPDDSQKAERVSANGRDARDLEAPKKNEVKHQERQTPRRRNLLETGDIADLDDILNDPDSTSDLPPVSQIDKEIKKESARKPEEKKHPSDAKTTTDSKDEADYENMQVTVDSFSPGMPAMVDTDIIAEDIGEVDLNNRTPSGRITGEMEFARDQYSEEQYDEDYYYNGGDDVYASDDDYYYGLSKKERKALEKQRRREEKEAEKDAKYLEKERKRAQKRKKYGYEEPTAMDWSAFSEELSDETDDRMPRGNDAEKMPAYMSGRSKTENDVDASEERQTEKNMRRKPSEAEMAEAAADAVIRAARGDDFAEETVKPLPDDEEQKREADYKAYRQGARNQYEEFRRLDEEEEARRAVIEATGRREGTLKKSGHSQKTGQMSRPQAPASPVQAPEQRVPMQQPPVQPRKVEYTQDLDEDFEFEFLNIKRPQ